MRSDSREQVCACSAWMTPLPQACSRVPGNWLLKAGYPTRSRALLNASRTPLPHNDGRRSSFALRRELSETRHKQIWRNVDIGNARRIVAAEVNDAVGGQHLVVDKKITPHGLCI